MAASVVSGDLRVRQVREEVRGSVQEIQNVTLAGSVGGGTFALGFRGTMSSQIP